MEKKLNTQQKKAIEHGDGPLLIIAGAGTGKTTVITERIRYLITEKNIKPENILALTFTEKAAAEMEERTDKIIPYGYTSLWVSTFHSFCDRILREEGINIGLNPNYRLMNEPDSIVFLKKNLFALDLDYYRPLGNPTKFLDALLTHFSRLQDEDITPEEYLKYANSLSSNLDPQLSTLDPEEVLRTQELARCYKMYTDLKLKEGLLDFSDLIAETLKLFRTRKQILNKYQKQFQYILVDEFQDTNFAQNELAILLSGEQKNITVVADDDQAIYRWRGAALSNVVQFKNNFPGAEMVTLTQNYRSTQTVLDSSYKLIQHNNPNRLEAIDHIDKHLISARHIKGAEIEFIHTERADEEAEEIALEIKKLTNKKQNFSDVAILVRANNHAQPITQALTRNRIPYQFLGPAQLFRQEEIKDLIAYLKVLYSLDDTVALFRVLQMEIFNLSMRDISTLLTFSRRNNLTLFETVEKVTNLKLADGSHEKITKLKEMILRHLERIKHDGAGQILYYFLTDSGLFTKILSYKTERGEQIAQNVAKFFDKIKNFESLNRDANLYAVVDWIDLMLEMGDSPSVTEIDMKEMNAVNILTIHSSKGLEFPIVFLVNLVNDRFPTRERREKIPVPQNLVRELLPNGDYHMQEERRLFYVGMTRAQDRLYFTAAKFYAEAKREKKFSPFVYEALPELLEKEQLEKARPTQLSLIDVTRDYGAPLETNLTKIENVNVNFLSFSALQSFDICPLHFRARYLLNLPAPTSAPLSFGTSMHNALKEFYDQILRKNKPALQDLREMLRRNWISEGYSEKSYEKKMYEKGERILANYFQHLYRENKKTLATELPFSFNLKRNGKQTGKYLNDVLRITGKIDRVDQLDGNAIEIIDYKTGRFDSMSKKSYELQLGLYALAATKVENQFLKRKPEEITVTLVYLEEGKEYPHKITQKDLAGIEDEILAKVKEIEKSDFKCSKSILCKTCEYKILCEGN